MSSNAVAQTCNAGTDAHRREYDRLVAPRRPHLFAFVLSMTRSRDIAEDVTQAAMLKMLEAWPRFKPRAENPADSVMATLCVIARRTYIDQYRRTTYRRARSTIGVDDIVRGAHGFDTRTEAPSVDAMAIDDTLLAALLELPPARRRAIVAHARGSHYTEIARELGVEVGTVMSALHRGRRELEERLRDYAAAEHGIRRASGTR